MYPKGFEHNNNISDYIKWSKDCALLHSVAKDQLQTLGP